MKKKKYDRFDATPRKIKFSSDYFKLKYVPSTVQLIQVIRTHKSKLTEHFIKYDATKLDGEQYPLPNAELLMLIFFYEALGGFHIFTTLRRRTLRKEEYYKKHIGELFDVEVSR